jgi:hypothetical protein
VSKARLTNFPQSRVTLKDNLSYPPREVKGVWSNHFNVCWDYNGSRFIHQIPDENARIGRTHVLMSDPERGRPVKSYYTPGTWSESSGIDFLHGRRKDDSFERGLRKRLLLNATQVRSRSEREFEQGTAEEEGTFSNDFE